MARIERRQMRIRRIRARNLQANNLETASEAAVAHHILITSLENQKIFRNM